MASILNFSDSNKLKQITDQFGEKQSYNPTYTITLPDDYGNLDWVEKIKDATSLKLSSCKHITDLSPLEQLNDLTELMLEDAEQLDTSVFINLSKIPKLNSLALFGAGKFKDLKNISLLKSLKSLSLQVLNCKNFEEVSSLSELDELYIISTAIENISFIEPLDKLNTLMVRPAPLKDLSPLKKYDYRKSLTSLDLSIDSEAYLPDIYSGGFDQVTLRYYHGEANINHIHEFSTIKNQLTIVAPIHNKLLKEIGNNFQNTKELRLVHLNDSESHQKIQELNLEALNSIERTEHQLKNKEGFHILTFFNHDYFTNKNEADKKNIVPLALPEDLNFNVFCDGEPVYFSKKLFEDHLSEGGKKLSISDENALSLQYLKEYPDVEKIEISSVTKYSTPISLQPLAFHKKLNYLMLFDANDAMYKELQYLKRLKKIRIRTRTDTDDAFDLSYLSKLEELEEVDIRSFTRSINIPLLANLKKLKKLELASDCLHEFDLGKCPRLETLATAIDVTTILPDQGLSSFRNIKNLRLGQIYTLEEKKLNFEYLLPLKNLESLTIDEIFLDYGINFASLGKLKSLKHLILDAEYYMEPPQVDYSFVQSLLNLESISIDQFLEFPLDQLEGLPKLKQIRIEQSFYSEEDVELLEESVSTFLMLENLEKIIIASGYNEYPFNPFVTFYDLIKKGVTVSYEYGYGDKTQVYNNFKLAEYSEDVKKDYGILIQLKDIDLDKDKSVSLDIVGVDEHYVNYDVTDLSILKNIKHLEEISITHNWEYSEGDDYTLDLTPLSQIQTLKKVHIDWKVDLGLLCNLSQLEELSLELLDFEKISPFKKKMESLKKLSLSNSSAWDYFTSQPEKLPNLEEINIKWCDPLDHQLLKKFPKLKKVNLEEEAIFKAWNELDACMDDLSSLTELEEITFLTLDNSHALKGFKKLKKCFALHVNEIVLIDEFVSDTKNIEIRALNISDTHYTEDNQISLLGGLNQSIESIYIHGGSFIGNGDFSFFTNYPKLENLRIRCSLEVEETPPTVDLKALGSLPKLKTLDLRYLFLINEMSEYVESFKPITDLKGFPKLTTFEAENFLEDLSALNNLPSLTKLKASAPKSLALKSNKLESLEFYATNLSDLKTLSPLPELRTLTVWGCSKIKDFSPLIIQKELAFLELWGCKYLTSLDFLSDLVNLRSVKISSLDDDRDPGITLDLHPLIKSPKIHTIDLAFNNATTDVSTLAKLPNLENIYLRKFHSIKNLQRLAEVKTIKEIRFDDVNSLVDLSLLGDLPELKSITLHGCKNINNPDFFDENEKVKVLITGSDSEDTPQESMKRIGTVLVDSGTIVVSDADNFYKLEEIEDFEDQLTEIEKLGYSLEDIPGDGEYTIMGKYSAEGRLLQIQIMTNIYSLDLEDIGKYTIKVGNKISSVDVPSGKIAINDPMMWQLHLLPEDDKDKKGFEVNNCFELPQGSGKYDIYALDIEYKKDKKLVTEHFGYTIDASEEETFEWKFLGECYLPEGSPLGIIDPRHLPLNADDFDPDEHEWDEIEKYFEKHGAGDVGFQDNVIYAKCNHLDKIKELRIIEGGSMDIGKQYDAPVVYGRLDTYLNYFSVERGYYDSYGDKNAMRENRFKAISGKIASFEIKSNKMIIFDHKDYATTTDFIDLLEQQSENNEIVLHKDLENNFKSGNIPNVTRIVSWYQDYLIHCDNGIYDVFSIGATHEPIVLKASDVRIKFSCCSKIETFHKDMIVQKRYGPTKGNRVDYFHCDNCDKLIGGFNEDIKGMMIDANGKKINFGVNQIEGYDYKPYRNNFFCYAIQLREDKTKNIKLGFESAVLNQT